MARFVNDTDYTLRSFVHGRDIGAHEEFDWPGYDEDTHGVLPGCRRLDEPAQPRKQRGKGDTGSNDNSAGGDPAAGQPATGDAAGDASKENPQ